jgi:hypothetical protein
MVPGPGWDMVRTMIENFPKSGLALALWARNSQAESSCLLGRCGDISVAQVALLGCSG